jgi:hypothetical protein
MVNADGIGLLILRLVWPPFVNWDCKSMWMSYHVPFQLRTHCPVPARMLFRLLHLHHLHLQRQRQRQRQRRHPQLS